MISAFRSRIRSAAAGRPGFPAAPAPGGPGSPRAGSGLTGSSSGSAGRRWLADALIAVVVTGVSLAWSHGAQSWHGHHYVMNAAGMRGRAQALGGSLEAGPQPGGGFQVTARLPARGEAR